MGKGDKRTRRGKISVGSYGKTRQKRHKAAFVASEKPVVEKVPKKRTPKVVKSAPAPEPAAEKVEAVAETPQTEQTPEAPAAEATPATAEAPAEETSEAAPAAEEPPQETAPVEESSNDASA
jgi:30S ribosomal protein S31